MHSPVVTMAANKGQHCRAELEKGGRKDTRKEKTEKRASPSFVFYPSCSLCAVYPHIKISRAYNIGEGEWGCGQVDVWMGSAVVPRRRTSFHSPASQQWATASPLASPRLPQYSQSVAVSRSSALAFSTPAWSPRRYLLSAAWRTASLL